MWMRMQMRMVVVPLIVMMAVCIDSSMQMFDNGTWQVTLTLGDESHSVHLFDVIIKSSVKLTGDLKEWGQKTMEFSFGMASW